MSDMNMMNSIGPSSLPCITPASTSSQSEYCLLDFTLFFLLVRYCAIHDVNQFGRSFSSLWSRMRWLIKSNAFLKSKKTACVVLSSSVALLQSSMTCISASMVFVVFPDGFCVFEDLLDYDSLERFA